MADLRFGALPGSIALLLDKIHSVPQSSGFAEIRTSASLLERLESSLARISYVIHDAVEQRYKSHGVDSWLLRLEYAVYDAEDIVDDILFEAATLISEAKAWDLISLAPRYLAAASSISLVVKRIWIIRKLVEDTDVIAKEMDKYGFKKRETHDDMRLSDSLPATSLLDETAIYGREEDRSDIVRWLLSGDENLDAIALVGIGGLGKTTLAQLVYKDEKVRAHFELKAWVGVHEDFEVDRITRIILEAVTFCSIEGHMSLELLLDKLRARIDGKKFLLVLDDVWNEDPIKWNALKTCLISVARVGKIIVTTRGQGVAACVGRSTRHLNSLTDDSCWSLLAKSAFAGRDRNEVVMLEDIGREILKTCGGIPLSVRVIGGLLRFKKTREEWCHVLEDLREANNDDSIVSILSVSYYHLPALLKRCFAYCSLLPVNHEFEKDKLVLLWMAEGFLPKSSGLSMEMLAAECVDGLLKRSFFIPIDNSHFKMHDLIHDLALVVSAELCLRWESSPQAANLQRIRHLSLLRGERDIRDMLSVVLRWKRLRTFYLIDSRSCQKSPQPLKDIFSRLRSLRVLSVPHFPHAKLPPSIGKLKYLHYLDFSHSKLKSLPKSLCTLYFLQTLILTNCSSLLMLPQGIVKLVNLRKLGIKGAGLEQMPEKMSRLTSLQSLTNFIVGHGGSSIKELGALPYLHGSLSVSGLQNVSSPSDASAANLKAMRYLDELELEWSRENKDPPTYQKEVLDKLKPSVELQKLSIRFYGGKEFPKWLGDSSLSKIISLHLSNCINCKSLPPLGRLSSLEHLIIERISGIKSIGHEFYGVDVPGCKPFQSLKTLKFGEMSQWEEWTLLEVDGEEFPCLEEFYVINCPLLKGFLPKSLPTLVKLEICECEQLEASLPQTSERCILKLDNCCKVQKKTQDKTLSKSDGEIASQFSSSMTEIPDNEIQLEESRNNKTPAKEKAVQEHVEPSGKLEEPSKSDGEITPDFSPSLIHQEQDHNQPTASPSEDGNQQLMEVPTDLHSLRIERYASDELPTEILGRSSLQHLYIIDCISLKTFPQSPSLKTLYIRNCKKLEFPQPNKVMNQDARLEDLCLGSSCDSLKNFPLNYFPKLKSLSLWDCRNLEHLLIEKGLQNKLTSLDSLEIKDCPNLRSFLEEEFQAPNLTSLVFFNCGSLKSLPGMQSIKSLQSLYINKCPALESFPVEGLPSSLITLCISFCDKITPQKGWKLDNLHSLSHFEIEGGCHELESFPEEGLLPTNLNSLRISRLSDLKFLDREGLQKLTSLQTLEINCCDKLDSLPERGLPSSLYSLSITDCSLLNPKLQNRKGREWFKIARVPSIQLDEVSD